MHYFDLTEDVQHPAIRRLAVEGRAGGAAQSVLMPQCGLAPWVHRHRGARSGFAL